MDAALRIVHVVLGTFWAGTVLYASVILFPQLRALGPTVERPAVRAIMRVTSPIMAAISLVVFGTGIAMVLRTRISIGALFETGWGWAMAVAFAAIVLYLIVGFGVLLPSGVRMNKLGQSVQGREATSAESQTLERLARRISTTERTSSVAVLVATVLMPLARFL